MIKINFRRFCKSKILMSPLQSWKHGEDQSSYVPVALWYENETTIWDLSTFMNQMFSHVNLIKKSALVYDFNVIRVPA